MSQSKPRKAAYKDTIVSLLSLKAHFAVSDDHPTDKSTAELGMLMLQHVPSPEKESLPWKGEYFDACTDFARTNQAEMKHNNCNVDQLLKATSANYFTGLALWRKAQDAKRIMLNDMHAVFCSGDLQRANAEYRGPRFGSRRRAQRSIPRASN
jgi:hypothetical protein